ncbi:MAG: hypothetical protein PHV37_07480 [Candidatus Gastranaerophilales bacterium]|nr:hypothetical protein [Candidatus Gastranaerophilales bacterium]
MDYYTIKLSYLSIITKNNNDELTSSGSGCFVRNNNNIYLVTAKHVSEPNEISYLERKYDTTAGTLLKPLQELSYAISVNIFSKEEPKEPKHIDVAFKNITDKFEEEYKAYVQDIDASKFPAKIKNEVENNILNISPNVPIINEEYSFAGGTRGQIVAPPIPHYIFQRIETCEIVKYKKTNENDNDIYIFTPLDGHRGHEVYQGCSGAPIINENGEVVAIVLGGNVDKNEIYGYNINKIKILMDAELLAEQFTQHEI